MDMGAVWAFWATWINWNFQTNILYTTFYIEIEIEAMRTNSVVVQYVDTLNGFGESILRIQNEDIDSISVDWWYIELFSKKVRMWGFVWVYWFGLLLF